jgi:hypothetical protein
MTAQRFDEVLKMYRQTKARVAYLRSQAEMLERFLRICSSQMIEDMMSMSQAITGMPHGSGTGDPTGRLAIDIESGKVSEFVKQIQEELTQVNAELNITAPQTRAVEIALGALNDRERDLVVMKMVDEFSWAEILFKMNAKHGGDCKKRTLQRVLEKAMQKAYEVVK